jgi:hypothetical protein
MDHTNYENCLVSDFNVELSSIQNDNNEIFNLSKLEITLPNMI